MFYKKKTFFSFFTYFFQNMKRQTFDKVAIVICFVKSVLLFQGIHFPLKDLNTVLFHMQVTNIDLK